MSDNKKEKNNILNIEINSKPINEELKLIGNKREREKEKEKEKEKETTDEEKKSKMICNCCKSSNIEENIFSKKLNNAQTFIDNFFKEDEFMKALKENIDKEISSNNKINKYCNKCILNEFIKGGITRIFSQKKSEDNDKKVKIEQEMPTLLNNKLQSLIGCYSMNLNLSIINLRNIKTEYLDMSAKVKEIFKDTCIKILLKNDNEPFQELKKKIDNCEENMKDIGSHFDDLINNLIDKQELKPFVLDSVKNDEPDQKNAILKILKRLEHETMNHIYESYENSNNNKEQDKKNIAENQLFINNEILKNNLLMSQSNLLNNGHNLFNPALGILPLGLQNNPSNNPLLNNLMLSSMLNPSILNQTNNTINLNSMLSNLNNNANEGNKNLNNLNNPQFPGLNNLHAQNPGLNAANNLETIYMIRNILNNNIPSNNMINNLYPNQINPNLISPIGPNNFFHPPSPLIHPNMNNSNNNNYITLNNNSSLDEKNLNNKKIPMNFDNNMVNIYQNNNNKNNNDNMNNTKDINSIINNINNANDNNKFLQNNLTAQNQPNDQFLLTKLFNYVAIEKNANSKNNNYSNNTTQK